MPWPEPVTSARRPSRLNSGAVMIRSPGLLLPKRLLRELLVGEHADQDDRAHHGEIQRARNAEQVDEVLQHLQQHGAEHDADDRAFAAAQRAAAEHRRGDGVELVEIAVRGGRDRARVHGDEDRRHRRQPAADDIGRDDDARRCGCRCSAPLPRSCRPRTDSGRTPSGAARSPMTTVMTMKAIRLCGMP